MIIKRMVACRNCGAKWEVDFDTVKEDLVDEDEWICPDSLDENEIHITELTDESV